MQVKVVKCQGMFKPGEIMLLRDSPPPSAPYTSESDSTLLKYQDFKVISSLRDGWSPARIRAADAEAWAYQDAADRIEDEESAAWAKHDEGPEPGATDDDIRIYTKLENGEYKYWGVKELHMTMEEFWARNDPDNTRERSADNTPGPLPAPAIPTSFKSPSPPHTASRSKRRRKAPDFNMKNRVATSTIVTPASKKGIWKSFASKIERRGPEKFEQNQDLANSSTREPTVATYHCGTRWPVEAERPQTISGVNSSTSHRSTTKSSARGRPRKTQSGLVDSSYSNPADWPTSTREDPPKRKRGRPAKEKYPTQSPKSHRSYVSNEKQKRPKNESKAKVTKSKLKSERPIAPSVHKMRTRAKGPAEILPRF